MARYLKGEMRQDQQAPDSRQVTGAGKTTLMSWLAQRQPSGSEPELVLPVRDLHIEPPVEVDHAHLTNGCHFGRPASSGPRTPSRSDQKGLTHDVS